jgi:hypothetical protein
MNKKIHILEFVDEFKETYSGGCGCSGIGLFLFIQNLWYGLFSFIHNLWYKFLFIHPQPQVWVSFYSSTISCIGLISFIHNNRPIPEVVDE